MPELKKSAGNKFFGKLIIFAISFLVLYPTLMFLFTGDMFYVSMDEWERRRVQIRSFQSFIRNESSDVMVRSLLEFYGKKVEDDVRIRRYQLKQITLQGKQVIGSLEELEDIAKNEGMPLNFVKSNIGHFDGNEKFLRQEIVVSPGDNKKHLESILVPTDFESYITSNAEFVFLWPNRDEKIQRRRENRIFQSMNEIIVFRDKVWIAFRINPHFVEPYQSGDALLFQKSNIQNFIQFGGNAFVAIKGTEIGSPNSETRKMAIEHFLPDISILAKDEIDFSKASIVPLPERSYAVIIPKHDGTFLELPFSGVYAKKDAESFVREAKKIINSASH